MFRRNQTVTATVCVGIVDAISTASWGDPKFALHGSSTAELENLIVSGSPTAPHSHSNLVVYDTTAAYLPSGVVPLSPAALDKPCSSLWPTRTSLPSFVVGLDRVLTCCCQTKLICTLLTHRVSPVFHQFCLLNCT